MKKIKIGLRAKDGNIHLDPSTADLYQGKYQGVIGLDVRGKKPKLDINTSLQGVQIEPLLKDYEQKPEAAGKDESSSSDLPVEMLRTLKIKGDLFIGQLVLSNITMKKIKMGLRAKDGDIHLDPSTADLYQGKYQGAIGLDVRGKMPKLDINTSLQGVQIEPLLKDYEQKPESQLAGVANISAHLTAAGKDPDKLKRALNGKVELRVNDGILRGIDVRKTLEAAEVLLESKRPGQVKQGGETRFQKLTATMNIKNGVVTNKDLLILAPGFRVNGEGMLANFHDNTIKYNLAIAVDESSATRGEESFNIGGYKVPIFIFFMVIFDSTSCPINKSPLIFSVRSISTGKSDDEDPSFPAAPGFFARFLSFFFVFEAGGR